MDSSEADLADESTFESQYSLEGDVFQASMIALHDSACSGELNYTYSLPLSTPKVKKRMVSFMRNFHCKCKRALLLDMNRLCRPGSNCTICYQIKVQFCLRFYWCFSDVYVEEGKR